MWFLYATTRMAVKALRRNVMRSALTTLGIIIGVSAVITMVEIGQGAKKSVYKAIDSMGANTIVIYPGNSTMSGATMGGGSAMTLTPDDCEAILERCRPFVVNAAPVVRARTQVVYGNRNHLPFYLYGTTAEYLKARSWDEIEEGHVFTDQDVRNCTQVCLLGQTVVRELFGGESPLGKEVRLNNKPFKVIGVLPRKGASMMGWDQDDVVLAPWRSIKQKVVGQSVANVNQSAALKADPSQQVNSTSHLYPSQVMSLYPTPSALQLADRPLSVRFTNIDQILVQAAGPDDLKPAMKAMSDVLRERHRLAPGDRDDFFIRDMTEMSRALSSTTESTSNFLMGVALISLVVGGVGIMNIMLVSVTERTREIGLRMAVGARARDILLQFLVEAVLLCLMGGILGVLLGRLCSLFVQGGSVTLFGRAWKWGLGWPVEISLPAMAAAVVVSGLVGVLFGYYPAWKASRLDPIEALRYE